MPKKHPSCDAASVAIASRSRRVDNSAILLGALVAALLVYFNYLFWIDTRYRVDIFYDSAGYLNWYPLRMPGYPAFLHIVHAITGDLRWLGVTQLNLLLLSFVALSYGFGRLTGSRLAGSAVFLLLFMAMPLLESATWALTEAVFVALICFHLAALCFYLRRPAVLPAVYIGATIGLIYMTRPNGVSFAVAAFLRWIVAPTTPPPPPTGNDAKAAPSRKRILVSAGSSLLAILAMMGAVNKIQHDTFFVVTPGGVVALGHVAHLVSAESGKGAHYERLLGELEKELKPRRNRVAAAAGLWPHWLETHRIYLVIRQTILPKLRRHFLDRAHAAPPRCYMQWGMGAPDEVRRKWPREMFTCFDRMSAAAADMAWITIKARPWEYTKHVAKHYVALWRCMFLEKPCFSYSKMLRHGAGRTLLDNKEFKNIVVRYMDTDYFYDDGSALHDVIASETNLIGRWWGFLADNRLYFLVALAPLFLLAFMLPLKRRYRREPTIQLCVYLAFTLHLSMLFIAAAHSAFHRLTLPFLPLLFLFVVGMAVILWRIIKARYRPRSSAPGDAVA